MRKLERFLLSTAAMMAAGGVLAAPASAASKVTETPLVSDGSVAKTITDPNLVNPWGIAYDPGGAFWVSDNVTGLTTLYDGTGAIQNLVVTIPPPAGASGPSAPTGQVYNATTDFTVTESGKTGAPAFIFATEDGTISGWAPSVDFARAVLAVDNSSKQAVYKGIAIQTAKSGNLLFATNFRSGLVEIYDKSYKLLSTFRDVGKTGVTAIPKTYAPYNVQVLGGAIFVTYAKQDKAKHDSVSAPGAGFVDEVGPDGTLIARIASHKGLNAPWGLAIAPPAWGKLAGTLLVGNFGDGSVSAYDIASGTFKGSLANAAGGKLSIDGLWGLSQGTGALKGDPTKIYFTAGPAGETHGVFGSLAFTKAP